MGGSIVMEDPLVLVGLFQRHPISKWMRTGDTPIPGNLHIYIYNGKDLEECNQHTDILGYQHSYGDLHSGKHTICYGNWESRFLIGK